MFISILVIRWQGLFKSNQSYLWLEGYTVKYDYFKVFRKKILLQMRENLKFIKVQYEEDVEGRKLNLVAQADELFV